MTTQRVRRIALAASAGALVLGVLLFLAMRALLSEIDPPERGIMAKADLPITVDGDCVEKALRSRFPDLNVLTGSAGDVPEGKFELIFDYYHPGEGDTWATLTLIDLGGSTRVTHFFLGQGAKLPQDVFPPALKAMETATKVLRADCGVDLSSLKFKPVGQRVDALN